MDAEVSLSSARDPTNASSHLCGDALQDRDATQVSVRRDDKMSEGRSPESSQVQEDLFSVRLMAACAL